MPEPVLDLRREPRKARRNLRLNLKPSLLLAVFAVAAVALAVITVVMLRVQASDPSPAAQLKRVKDKVGRHYLLPTGETPVLATVTDKSQVSALFLKNAQNGDQILIYQRNRLAIVYRPSIDKIIAVGPVTYDLPSH